MNKIPQLTIVFYGADICTGSCGYCTGAIGLPSLKQGTGADVLKSIDSIDKRLYDLIQFDFDALENKIINHELFKNSSKIRFSIWGGDPLASFMSFQDIYDFLKYIGHKHNKEVLIGGSTNGLAFLDPNKTQWMLEHSDISMQLSHDGVGQWIRTKDIDPLKIDGVDELFKNKRLNSINSNLSLLNASPFQNIEYFNQFSFLNGNSTIRLNFMRDERYERAISNPDGKLNNTTYESLKGSSFVDICPRNDIELAKKYNVFIFAHQADLMFDEYYKLIENIDKYPLYKKPTLARIAIMLRHRGENDVMKFQRPKCAQYHLGQRDDSVCIDTLGNYTVCHLYDSRLKQINNPTLKHPDKCNGCPYINSYECNTCGRTDLSNNECQLNYRLNLMADHFKDLVLD